MLEEPDESSGIDVDGQRGVGVEAVVGDVFVASVAQRAGVVGLRRAEEGEVERAIVAARHPHRRTVALVERQPVPAVATVLARARDGVHAPGCAAGRGIERDDEIAAGRTAGRADHHLSVGHQRTSGQSIAGLRIGDGLVPHHAAGLRIERHDVRVGCRHVQSCAVDRDAALHRRRAAFSAAVRGTATRDLRWRRRSPAPCRRRRGRT